MEDVNEVNEVNEVMIILRHESFVLFCKQMINECACMILTCTTRTWNISFFSSEEGNTSYMVCNLRYDHVEAGAYMAHAHGGVI